MKASAWAPQLAPNGDPRSLECDAGSSRTWHTLATPTTFSHLTERAPRRASIFDVIPSRPVSSTEPPCGPFGYRRVAKPQQPLAPIRHLGFGLASRGAADAVANEANKDGRLRFGPTFLNPYASSFSDSDGYIVESSSRPSSAKVIRSHEIEQAPLHNSPGHAHCAAASCIRRVHSDFVVAIFRKYSSGARNISISSLLPDLYLSRSCRRQQGVHQSVR